MTWKAFIFSIVASLVAGFISGVIFYWAGFDQGKRDGYKVGWQDALRTESGKIAETLEQEIRPQVMQAVIQEKCGEEIRKAQDEGYRKGRAEALEEASIKENTLRFLDWFGEQLRKAESLEQAYSKNPDPKLQATINLTARSIVTEVDIQRSFAEEYLALLNGRIQKLEEALQAGDDKSVNEMLLSLAQSHKVKRETVITKYNILQNRKLGGGK